MARARHSAVTARSRAGDVPEFMRMSAGPAGEGSARPRRCSRSGGRPRHVVCGPACSAGARRQVRNRLGAFGQEGHRSARRARPAPARTRPFRRCRGSVPGGRRPGPRRLRNDVCITTRAFAWMPARRPGRGPPRPRTGQNHHTATGKNPAGSAARPRGRHLALHPRLTIPPTNNQAERDACPAKTQQKIFGRLRSEKTTDHRYAIRGYISTAAKHGIDIRHRRLRVAD
jgi:hypothetical protein